MKIGQTEQTFSKFAHPVVSNDSHRLVGSDRVEGTHVFRPNGETLGRVERLMIEKRTGRPTR